MFQQFGLLTIRLLPLAVQVMAQGIHCGISLRGGGPPDAPGQIACLLEHRFRDLDFRLRRTRFLLLPPGPKMGYKC
jgi:hypothetical protein